MKKNIVTIICLSLALSFIFSPVCVTASENSSQPESTPTTNAPSEDTSSDTSSKPDSSDIDSTAPETTKPEEPSTPNSAASGNNSAETPSKPTQTTPENNPATTKPNTSTKPEDTNKPESNTKPETNTKPESNAKPENSNKPDDTNTSEVTAMQGTFYAASDGGLNVRSGPSSEHDKLGMLQYGEKVSVTGKIGNNWYRITYDGKDGYVSSQYLSDTPLENSDPADSPNTELDETENDFTEDFIEFEADLDTVLESEYAELEGSTSLINTPIMLALLFAILIVLALICYSIYDLFHKDEDEDSKKQDDDSEEEYYEEEVSNENNQDAKNESKK